MRSMVSLHLGSKHATGTLGPETQSPQTLDSDRSRKEVTGLSPSQAGAMRRRHLQTLAIP